MHLFPRTRLTPLLRSHLVKGRQVILTEATALKAVQQRLDQNFGLAVEAMHETIRAKGKLIVTGIGKSGQIGAKIAATLSSTGAPSVVLDAVNASHGDLGVPVVAIDTLLESSDVISLNLSLTDETRSFLDARRLARIKPGAILVNTARGALVDEAALIEGLESGRIRHAGLDVFHAEPLKPDHPLAKMRNVTLSPHAAFRTLEASINLLRRALDIVRRIEGHPAVPG